MTDISISIIDNRKPTPFWKQCVAIIVMGAVAFTPGMIFNNAPMQWAGFVLFLWVSMVGFSRLAEDREELTLHEAQEKLNRLRRAEENDELTLSVAP